MDPVTHDLPSLSTCTSCQFTEDLSNYWTAVLFFKAQNGTYKRVPIRGNVGFEGSNGGMTIYYMQDGLADFEQKSTVTAFRPVSFSPLRHPPDLYAKIVGICRASACSWATRELVLRRRRSITAS